MRIPAVLKTLLGAACAAALLGTAHGQATAPPPPARQPGAAPPATPPAAAPATPAAAAPATPAMAPAATLGKGDQKILMDMAQGNMAEIETAKLAQTKSQNDQVKTFAQQMIDDHTKALAEVQQVAGAKGVSLPAALDAKHQAAVDKMGAMAGPAFDKAYMKQAGVADHKKMHNALASAEKKAKDPDVKALAAKMMPTVEQHLKAAQQMGSAKGMAKNGKPAADTAAGK